MSSLYQLYATIPQSDWYGDLKLRFPHAPLINGYRVLVFTNVDYPDLIAKYSEKEFLELQAGEIITAIESGQNAWLVCDVENIRIVIKHFRPPSNGTESI